jgi:hypothetical protein
MVRPSAGQGPSNAGGEERDEHTEDESADVREERHKAAARLAVDQSIVAREELVQEPAAEIDPGGDI